MLTRIEIDGFKTFQDFKMDLGPFLVVLGPNASGKSNLFDAIQLLSRLAGADLRTAVKGLRGEPHELFRRGPEESACKRMCFAVELLLDPVIRDPWGATKDISHSRVRYEVEIEMRKDDRDIERLFVTREEARPIARKDDAWMPYGRRVSRTFAKVYLKYGRQQPWLSTTHSEASPSFEIHQDGRQGRKRPADAAEATVLSSITSAEFPHLYALREEFRSWRFLQLDPISLRRPSPTTAAEEMEPDGSNLATVLARMQAETRTDTRPKGVLADIAADLASLVPGVVGLEVTEDRKNREFRVEIGMRDSRPFNARVMSDGTLRILALLTLLHDPKQTGLICFEEPENGIHPVRLKTMIERLRELVCDPTGEPGDAGEPLTQILMNSHSPVVLSALKDGEIMFADVVTTVIPKGVSSRKTRIRPVLKQDQGELLDERGDQTVTSFEVNQLLATVDQGSDRR